MRKILSVIRRKIWKHGNENKGVSVVELILILVVLIGLVVIFRDQLTSLINGIFERIVNDSQAV
jgi:hypothetical protein